MGTETWLGKLEKIDARYIYVIGLILLAIPMFRPLHLPIYVNPLVDKWYNIIEELQPGDRVFIWNGQSPGYWGDIMYGYHAIVQHLFLKPGVIMITAGGVAPAPPLMTETINIAKKFNPLNKTEGIDYVQLPYIPGGETALAQMARPNNFRAALGANARDIRGISVDQLPAMQGIKSVTDFKVIMDLTNSPAQMVRQFYVPYPTSTTGIQYLQYVTIAFMATTALPFLNAGFTSVAGGCTDGVQYESLLNKNYGAPFRSGGIETVDGFVSYFLFTIIMVVIGNLKLISERVKKQGVKK